MLRFHARKKRRSCEKQYCCCVLGKVMGLDSIVSRLVQVWVIHSREEIAIADCWLMEGVDSRCRFRFLGREFIRMPTNRMGNHHKLY
jgi:hypothetical protein